jgi:hypothetical protein
MIAAAILGVLLLLVAAYEFTTFSSTNASTTTAITNLPTPVATGGGRPAPRRSAAPVPGKKEKAPQSLDPTLHLDQLALSEQIKYEGSGRNIFIAQAEPVDIPKAQGNGTTDKQDTHIYQPQPVTPPPPIPLKFFGFANRPGEPKRVFLIKGEDTFIAGEGEIVDRRYKVVKISPTSVDIQDVVGSGPPQSIPLTQEKPS